MKAAVLRELNAPLSIEDIDIDKPGPNEVLTRTAASGGTAAWISKMLGIGPPRPTCRP